MTNAEIEVLVHWLTENRSKLVGYGYKRLNKFYRITSGNNGSSYCFVAEYDFRNKALGEVHAGDIFMPASWSQPAKHKRGSLYDPATWDKCFGEYGVNYLR